MADLKAFVEAPSLENLETLKKAELIEVCKLLEVEAEIKRSFRKDQLNCLLFIWGFMSLSTLYRSYHNG